MKTTAIAMRPRELAGLYGVDVRTFRNWLKPFDKKKLKREGTHFYSPKQVRYIYECLDPPEINSTKTEEAVN